MSSKYANLEWLALFLANGHCHSTWGEKRLKHEFQSGMLAALRGFCPRHGNNLPKLQHDFVLIFVLRIVATVAATGKEPIDWCLAVPASQLTELAAPLYRLSLIGACSGCCGPLSHLVLLAAHVRLMSLSLLWL